jgi:hypothetical protein
MTNEKINLNADGTEYTFKGYENILKFSLLDLEDVDNTLITLTKMELKGQKPQFLVQTEKNEETTFKKLYKTISGAKKAYNSKVSELI